MTTTTKSKSKSTQTQKVPLESVKVVKAVDAVENINVEGTENDNSVLDKSTKIKNKNIEIKNKNKNKVVPAVLPGAGVIYLSRIPHGFYEDQMRAYFSQFGEITRLRLARNKRTGASKHYAYLEFRHEAVARIVAETMHNYLMFGRLLQCHLVPVDRLHPETFVGANRRFRVIPWKKIAREAFNAEVTPEKAKSREERRVKHLKDLEDKCKLLGIEWDSKDL